VTTLLVVALGLLLLGCLGLAVRVAIGWLAAAQRNRATRADALAAEIRLQHLTRLAMQQMLEEARRAGRIQWQ